MSLGDKTFEIIKKHCKEIICVSETEIMRSMDLIMQNLKIIVEPSAALSLAAVIKEK